jgi:hypothetical protein
MFGKFVALAETTFGPSKVGLTITPAPGGKPVFSSSNVDTATGVNVKALKPGSYKATWVVINPNGDTRTTTTRFIEEDPSAPAPSGPTPKVTCKPVSGKHQLKCNVSFAKGSKVSGMVHMRLSRGGNVAAMGHSRLHHGSTAVTMRELRSLKSGTWRITVVFTSDHHQRTVSQHLLVV